MPRGQQMTRTKVSPGGLYTLLNSELKRRRTFECLCQMPLPYLVARPDPVSANWRIGTPKPCEHGCDGMIAEIITALWPKYELVDITPEVTPEAEKT